MDFLKQNKLLFGIAIILLIGAFYYFAGGTTGSGDGLTATAADSAPETAQLLASLSSLHTIQLDDSIFSDPAFLSLTDFGVVIPAQDVGRRNPFAPVGSAARLGTAATSSGAQ